MTNENIQRIRRVAETLRATGTPMAKYLAEDLDGAINATISAEAPTSAIALGLSDVEYVCIREGRYINAIKEHRARMMREGKNYSLVGSKDFICACGAKMGLYYPASGKWSCQLGYPSAD